MTYGLAWGVNHGILKGKVYRKAVEQGWKALCSYVREDGKLEYGQPVAGSPGKITKDMTCLLYTSELGRETVSAYAAAKGGLKMLTRNIASEYGEYNIPVSYTHLDVYKRQVQRLAFSIVIPHVLGGRNVKSQ